MKNWMMAGLIAMAGVVVPGCFHRHHGDLDLVIPHGHVHSHDCGHWFAKGKWHHSHGHVHGPGCGHHHHGGIWKVLD